MINTELASVVSGKFMIGACRVRDKAGLSFLRADKTGVLLPMDLKDAELLVRNLQKRIAEARAVFVGPPSPVWQTPAARWDAEGTGDR